MGNASPWQAKRVIVPRDDRAFSFSSGNVRRTISTAYRRTLTANNIPGSTLTVTGDGDAFYIVGRVGAAYGRMQVTIDGASTTVDTGYYQGKALLPTRDRVMLFSAYLAPGTHTVTITNAGSAGRVTLGIDAIDFARQKQSPTTGRVAVMPSSADATSPAGGSRMAPQGVADTHVDAVAVFDGLLGEIRDAALLEGLEQAPSVVGMEYQRAHGALGDQVPSCSAVASSCTGGPGSSRKISTSGSSGNRTVSCEGALPDVLALLHPGAC